MTKRPITVNVGRLLLAARCSLLDATSADTIAGHLPAGKHAATAVADLFPNDTKNHNKNHYLDATRRDATTTRNKSLSGFRNRMLIE